MHRFSSDIKIIGVNPYVSVPDEILSAIFLKAKKDKGPIPVCGVINNKPYTQTLVKYAGNWRLYINTKMLKNSPKHVGENISILIDFDSRSRAIPLHPKLRVALDGDPRAKEVYELLTASRRHEINRYITNLKSDEKVKENVDKAIDFLSGKGRFVGRDKP